MIAIANNSQAVGKMSPSNGTMQAGPSPASYFLSGPTMSIPISAAHPARYPVMTNAEGQIFYPAPAATAQGHPQSTTTFVTSYSAPSNTYPLPLVASPGYPGQFSYPPFMPINGHGATTNPMAPVATPTLLRPPPTLQPSFYPSPLYPLPALFDPDSIKLIPAGQAPAAYMAQQVELKQDKGKRVKTEDSTDLPSPKRIKSEPALSPSSAPLSLTAPTLSAVATPALTIAEGSLTHLLAAAAAEGVGGEQSPAGRGRSTSYHDSSSSCTCGHAHTHSNHAAVHHSHQHAHAHGTHGHTHAGHSRSCGCAAHHCSTHSNPPPSSSACTRCEGECCYHSGEESCEEDETGEYAAHSHHSHHVPRVQSLLNRSALVCGSIRLKPGQKPQHFRSSIACGFMPSNAQRIRERELIKELRLRHAQKRERLNQADKVDKAAALAADLVARERQREAIRIFCDERSCTDANAQRVYTCFHPYFKRDMDVYTAMNDTKGRVLVRASTLAEKFKCATNKVGMYLARRRLVLDGIYQAVAFHHKPAGKTGLKIGKPCILI